MGSWRNPTLVDTLWEVGETPVDTLWEVRETPVETFPFFAFFSFLSFIFLSFLCFFFPTELPLSYVCSDRYYVQYIRGTLSWVASGIVGFSRREY